MNLNSTFAKSMNLKIKNEMNGSNQCRSCEGRRGAGGSYPLNGRLCPHFGLLKIPLLEHHATTRQQTIMEKIIVTFKHISPLIFFSILCEIAGNQLLYINLTQYSVLLTRLYGCVAEETCKPAESLPGTSLVIMTWNNTWKPFFHRPAVLNFRAHSRFWGHSQRRNY